MYSKLDIDLIKKDKEKFKAGIKKRGMDSKVIDNLIELHDEWTKKLQVIEELKHQQNEVAKEGKFSEEGKKLKEQLKEENENFTAWDEYEKLAIEIPNTPLDSVPEGDESKNKILRKVGEQTKLKKPKDHIEIGEFLGIIDIPRAAKVSGSRFAYLKGDGVILEMALVQYAMETLVKEGFTPVIPPALVKKDITEGLGYWHGGGNENYYFVRDFELEGDAKGQPLDLYLIGTGEHALVPMHMDETFDEKELPKKYAAFSPCFRREAGAYGKDTRGILRVHQFDKVEMVEFVKPEDDETERKKMLSFAEGFMKSLGLPYQVVQLAAGDLGFPAAETIDIETWVPSQGRYRETHSISTTTDFQARRLNIKFGSKLGSSFVLGSSKLGSRYVHILNGTAFAIGRTIIAILENFQQKDGSVKIPEVLQKYTNFSEIQTKK